MRRSKWNELSKIFSAVSRDSTVYVPQSDGPVTRFAPWTEDTVLSGATMVEKNPKELFFPQSENLMAFKMAQKKIEIIDTRRETEDFVLFGIRACDVRALTVLDNVFLADPVDTYYENRRRHGVIVSLACDRPMESCFCGTFGIDAADPEGDVVCHRADDLLYWDAKTAKGEAFLQKIEAFTEDADENDAKAVDERKAVIRERLSKLPFASLTTEGFGGGKTAALFDDPAWATLSESCLGCGTCTFVCPTCQCYDIKDYDTGHGIQRYRCWDSCMYSDFTMMAHGNNRTSQMQRFRQRFMHKLVYFPANNDGMFSCTGCGRCVEKCPQSLNIVKVIKAFAAQGGKTNE